MKIALEHAHRRGWINGSLKGSGGVALIGDHPNDIRAARANGVRSVAVATGMVGAEELAQHHPDLLVADMRSLSLEMLAG